MESTRGERILLCGIFLVMMPLVGCRQLGVRMEIQNANRAYAQRRYDVALEHYLAARQIDPSMVDLDRLIGYCYIGRFEPENETKENQQVADQAIESLKRYLVARPDDLIARDTLISLFLAADRNAQAIGFFADHLKKHPGDLDAAKSIATLSAKAGDFPGALHWYREITLLDGRNPEAFYIYGVVIYEKVHKRPDLIEAANLTLIEEGKTALGRAIQLRPDYFEALVYLNLLYREQANRLEGDDPRRLELETQAEELRERAIAIQQARKAAGRKP